MKHKMYDPCTAVIIIIILVVCCGILAFLFYVSDMMIGFVISLCLFMIPIGLVVDIYNSRVQITNEYIIHGLFKKKIAISDIQTIDLKDTGFGKNDVWVLGMGELAFEIITKTGDRHKISAGFLCSEKRCLAIKKVMEKSL